MAAKRVFADLDAMQEGTVAADRKVQSSKHSVLSSVLTSYLIERHLQDTTRRSSYPTAFTTTTNPPNVPGRHLHQSITTSRSARTLPLPSPTWSSPTTIYPSPQVLSTWEVQGPQAPQQPLPHHFFTGTSSDSRSLTVPGDHTSLVKSDPNLTPSLADPDEVAQVPLGDFAGPETERQRLKSEIGHLQVQIEDLHRQMDLFKQHAARKDAQYLQIIGQATRREVQGAADSRKWREDRKQWAEERQLLQDTIAGLNTKLSELHKNYSQGGLSEAPQKGPIHSLTSHESFSTPRPTLSQQNTQQIIGATEHPSQTSGTETPLDQLQYQSGQLAEYSTKLVDIGKNIRLQLDLMKATDTTDTTEGA